MNYMKENNINNIIIMFAVKKWEEVLYILDSIPSDEEIKDMWWDSVIEYIQPTISLTNEEIGESITKEVYDGNPYAQIADLAKAQVTTLAFLVQILGKDVVVAAYADLIVTVKKVSEARVKQRLSPYDLSFLE